MISNNMFLFASESAEPNLIWTIVAILAIFILPCLMIFLTQRVKFFKVVGAVALCYVLGFAFSLSGLNYDKALIEKRIIKQHIVLLPAHGVMLSS